MRPVFSSASRNYIGRMSVMAAVCFIAAFSQVQAQEPFLEPIMRQIFEVEQMRFVQIPGPNPIITPGSAGAWDDGVVEAADAFEHLGKYYFYYHATGQGKGYRLGVASADHPLGPFTKHGDAPILDLGPEGSWEDQHVACAMVMRDDHEHRNVFYMWYSAIGDEKKTDWSIGLATADHPLGPWTKHPNNPVMKDFGYLGGVVKIDGKYRLYSAFPINQGLRRRRSLRYHGDYSPLAVAIGNRPQGPFEHYEGNPLMEKGDVGDWDDGGISEAEVLYHNGMFHKFYGATRTYGPRQESIGYAYSFDGFKWYKYGRNPVAMRHANPNAAAFAEVHAIIEPPFAYLYHTLRYERLGEDDFPWQEHLGVQVLAMQTPFSLDMPVLQVDALGAGASTALDDSPPISLGTVNRVSLTVGCTFGDKAREGLVVHVRSSADGEQYDTTDLYAFEVPVQAGQAARKTFALDSNVRFIKVMVENGDRAAAVTDVKVVASLGS